MSLDAIFPIDQFLQGFSYMSSVNKNKVKAVIFDMDGVLIDSERFYSSIWAKAGKPLGFNIDDSFYIEKLYGKSFKMCEDVMLEEYGKDFPVGKFISLVRNIFDEELASSGIPLRDGVAELLDFVELRSLPKAIGTSGLMEDVHRCLRPHNILARFQAVSTADQVKHAKPAPDIFLNAASKIGVAAENIIVIEDSELGVLAAHRAGMRVIMATDLIQPSRDIASKALKVVGSLHDVPMLIDELI